MATIQFYANNNTFVDYIKLEKDDRAMAQEVMREALKRFLENVPNKK